MVMRIAKIWLLFDAALFFVCPFLVNILSLETYYWVQRVLIVFVVIPVEILILQKGKKEQGTKRIICFVFFAFIAIAFLSGVFCVLAFPRP